MKQSKDLNAKSNQNKICSRKKCINDGMAKDHQKKDSYNRTVMLTLQKKNFSSTLNLQSNLMIMVVL